MSLHLTADRRWETTEVFSIDQERTADQLCSFRIAREPAQDEAQVIMDRLVRAYLERRPEA